MPGEVIFIFSSKRGMLNTTPGYNAFSASRSTPNTISALDKGTHAFKRRVQGQVLSEPALKAVEDRMLEQVQDFVNYIDSPEDRVDTVQGHGEWVQRNVSDVCKYLTYNVLTDLCYGKSLNLFYSPTMRWLLKAVIPFSRMVVMDLAAPSLYLKRWDRLLFTPYLKEIYRLGEWVKKAHAARLSLGQDAKRNDLFHGLSKAVDPKTGEELSEKEFWLELLMLLVAGSDTTSIALNAVTYHLAHNRHSLLLATEEVRDRFATVDEIRTGPELSDCRFLHSCIEESMRLSSPVVHGPPRLVQAGGIVVDGEYFAEGTVVSTPTYTLHRSGKNFDAPDDFKPERWMTEGEELKRARQAYQPFHVGAYSCVGWRLAMMELQVSLARLLFTYDLRLPPNASCCNKAPQGERCQLEMKGWMTSHVVGPQVQFRRRSIHEENEDRNAESI
ncbi:hypothetical protein KC332_g7432 [Hortaea werneckii]|uniref:Uncharacterized protein n=1 Tax=Hortaea werneckii EXF-2000 TaxID=1157616 RepID=A0A1Z5SV62_HORWE|nr:hypothetical protein KC358_g1823 [Hortaea werneckii]OTA24607.1 hypothetical protein BTJ68_10507 [Hortaea werneckii EXF-2000]KAI6849839.1 hypothetical protein KC350_g2421 [Hortaea werneckii]KAI6935960.1 hypothetical protein KC341_g6561 [Hortaea werneckii]KAI6948997.1 hypothetical protein KC348_g1636 [Hortaea werneckii]